MHTRIGHRAIVVSFLSFLSLFAVATTHNAAAAEKTQYGLGFQATLPAYGISGMMDFSDKISGQLVLGPFGALKTYAVRGLYRFQRKNYWNIYGYGMVGAWSYTLDKTETAIGAGVGAGIEYDWRGIDPELPPLFWNFEIGIGFAGFDKSFYSYSAIAFGGGVHYRF